MERRLSEMNSPLIYAAFGAQMPLICEDLRTERQRRSAVNSPKSLSF